MGAAIILLVILTVSVVVVRTAAVALQECQQDVARFQARSAFTGTGFTTSESEAVVNHPIWRRLIGLLRI